VQAMLAEERIREWGGNVELPQTQETGPSESTVARDATNGPK
jgi:multidrug resistance protein, MATE family